MQQDEGGLHKHQVQQVEEFRRDCLDPVGGACKNLSNLVNVENSNFLFLIHMK
jgi:hypothetical protein